MDSVREKGFTLIELLIVVAIIAIIAGISIPAYLGVQRKAAREEAYSNLTQIKSLEEQYFQEYGCYRADVGGFTDNTGATPGDLGAAPGSGGASGCTGLTDHIGFRPGNEPGLQFTYTVVASAVGVTPPTFTATATGKAGTRVAGDVFTIDQNGTKTGGW